MQFSSREYEFCDIHVILGGRDITGLRGIDYTSKQEKELLYGRGCKPHSVQRGNKSYEGTVTLLQSELETIELSSGGDILDVQVDIMVTYGDPSKGDVLQTDYLKGCEFTEVPKGMKQGDKFSEHALPFVCLDVIRGY